MTSTRSQWLKNLVFIVPMVFLGVVLLIAGIGKLWAGTVAGETEFFSELFHYFWGPTMSWLIATLLPPAEVILALLLLSKVLPRISAVLTLPLIAGFMANNAYAISKGVLEYQKCGYCFGVFENLLGSPTPTQSLCIDIAMFVAALIVVFMYPAGFHWRKFGTAILMLVLALFPGVFGVHRFYQRKFGTAVVMLIMGIVGFVSLGVYGTDVGLPFLTVIGSWALADFVVAVVGVMGDKPIKNWKWEDCSKAMGLLRLFVRQQER
jgi:TM2 domain-containing membrane protein YozV